MCSFFRDVSICIWFCDVLIFVSFGMCIDLIFCDVCVIVRWPVTSTSRFTGGRLTVQNHLHEVIDVDLLEGEANLELVSNEFGWWVWNEYTEV